MAKRKVKVKKIGKILLLVVMVICAGVIYWKRYLIPSS